MIVTMLPIPLTAVAAMYSWMRREERDEREALQRLRESPS